MVGDEASENRSLLDIKYPLDRGIVRDWNDAIILWEYIFFTKLAIPRDQIGEHYILLTEPPQNPKQNREKMVEVCQSIVFSYVKFVFHDSQFFKQE